MTTRFAEADALAAWKDHEFYTSSLVLGIDVGLSYIGLSLRLGKDVLAGETVVYSSRDSLEARRLKRHWRRNRRGAGQRVFQLRKWSKRFGLPWPSLDEWQKEMTPAFRLRLRGEEHPGSLTPTELVVCLRHILLRRGYDWHRTGETEKAYPWGDGRPLSRECDDWLGTQYITPEVADLVRASLPLDLEKKKRDALEDLLTHALERSRREGLVEHLRAYIADPYGRRARGRNFPREVLEAHAGRLIRSHAAHFPQGRVEDALDAYLKIINYHRKDEAAQKEHWEKKAGKCPFTGEPRAPASDPYVRSFRLLEFLATRRFAVTSRKRSPFPPTLRPVPASVIAWLVQHPEGQSEPLPAAGDFRGAFEDRVCGENEKLAPNKGTLNEAFFSQLKDLLYPRPASAAQRAALSARAAHEWFNHATANQTSFEPTEIKRALSQVSSPGEISFYEKRREAQLAEWFHPHVEFLLGPRAYLLDDKKPPAGQVHGWLNRLLVRPEIAARLRSANHSGRPDYVVIEVVGDIPRTSAGRRKIEDEQKERREARDLLIAKYGLTRADDNSLLRAALWEQQGGTDELPATCPLTGNQLTGGPLNPNFELAHIYPRTWGGPFFRDNLFLTTRETNASMNNLPPARCAGFDRARVALMRWPERKRELFTKLWDPQGDRPDWGLDTRVAQLARQLRDAMRRWLGISDENEFTRRVGTVTGYFTAQCRKAWMEDYRKDRADLRNHLYDAMVLTHIPPGVGLNSAAFGGIFVTRDQRQEDGTWATLYRPPAEIGPDWRAYERAHEHDCLVKRPRSRASKSKRFDDTIYGIEKVLRKGRHGNVEQDLRLRVREVITDANGGWPVKDAEKWFLAAAQRSPAFAKMFPEEHWRQWLAENARRKAEGEPSLSLVAAGAGAVRAISVDASKPEFFDPGTLSIHGERGAKNPTERNIALDLFECAMANGRKRVISRVVTHPRLKKMRARWKELGLPIADSDGLPSGVQRIARVVKGDVLCLPLMRDGEIARSYENAYRRVWFHVTALKTSGQVQLMLAEFVTKDLKVGEDGSVDRTGSRLYGLRIKDVYAVQNETLVRILRLNGRIIN
jgi:hypothetical protein